MVFQLGQPRILLAMSRDGLLPRAFGRIHPRFKTPHVATIVTAVFVALVSVVSVVTDAVLRIGSGVA